MKTADLSWYAYDGSGEMKWVGVHAVVFPDGSRWDVVNGYQPVGSTPSVAEPLVMTVGLGDSGDPEIEAITGMTNILKDIQRYSEVNVKRVMRYVASRFGVEVK